MKRATLLVAMVLAATALPGCLKKKVALTFANHADRALEVHLTGPSSEGTGMIGTMEPGGTVAATLQVAKRDMPVVYTWTAGPFKGALTLWKGTPSQMTIDVGKTSDAGNVKNTKADSTEN